MMVLDTLYVSYLAVPLDLKRVPAFNISRLITAFMVLLEQFGLIFPALPKQVDDSPLNAVYTPFFF